MSWVAGGQRDDLTVFVVNKNPTAKDLRKFGWAMLAGFGLLGAVLWVIHWRKAETDGLFFWSGSTAQVAVLCMWGLGIALWVTPRFSTGLGKPVYVIWMTVATALGVAMSTVVMTLLFVFLLPVFALLVRTGDPLRRKLTSDGTYWENYKPYDATMERMRRQF